jgi:hypothetical protein
MRILRPNAQVLPWIGFALYLISYLLPAIGDPEHQPGLETHPIPGYFCAFYSIVWGVGGLFGLDNGSTTKGHYFFLSLLLPGLSNPLFLVYLGLSVSRMAPRTRRVLAFLVPLFIAASLVPLIMLPFVPLVGFYLWIAGAFILVAPDIVFGVSEMLARLAEDRT